PCETPEAGVEFLKDNLNVPSVYAEDQPAPENGWQEKSDRLHEDPTERFPVLPPPRNAQQMFDRGFLSADAHLTDEVDSYTVAQAWYGYAQEPIPPPGELPGSNGPITDR